MNIYTLERRLAKIEKERGVTVDTDNPLHQLLRAVGEPPCATDDEAFLRLLRLMQTVRQIILPKWVIAYARLR